MTGHPPYETRAHAGRLTDVSGAEAGAPTTRSLEPVSWRPVAVVVVGTSLLLSALSLLLPVVVRHQLTRDEGPVQVYVSVLYEHNLPTWWSVCLLAWGAVLHATVALLTRARGLPGASAWWSTAALLAVLSLDDLSELHERTEPLVRSVVDPGGFPYAWVFVGVPAALLMLTVALVAARRMPPRAARRLVAGLALLFGAAIGIEILGGLVLSGEGTGPLFAVLVHVEELGENVGAILAGSAAVAAARWERSVRGLHVTPLVRERPAR